MKCISKNKTINNLIEKLRLGVLTGNELKIFALITMTLDHIGLQLMDNYLPFRIIGRLAFPIFAFMVAEGCRYTRNRLKYLLMILVLGAVCQVFYTGVTGKWDMNIFITLSISILIIYALDFARESADYLSFTVPLLIICMALFVSKILPDMYKGSTFKIDYGFFGIMLPVTAYISKNRTTRLLFFGAGLLLLSFDLKHIQWWGLLALIPLALYNGKRGKHKIKYFFYTYYPMHLVAIYAISELL